MCPLDGIAVYSDGHLEGWGPAAADSWRYATSFRQGIGQLLLSLGVASLLIGLGRQFRSKQTQSANDS